MKEYQNRDTLEQLFGYFTNTDVMVEVGSFQGSSTLVWARKFKKIICVDPWLGELGDGKEARKDTYEVFMQRTAIYNNITKLRMTSDDGAKQIPDNSVDFVYIDALHDYENVKNDIKLWLPKVKSGGFIGGHDYGYAPLPDVKRAVDEMLGIPVIYDTEFSWLVKV